MNKSFFKRMLITGTRNPVFQKKIPINFQFLQRSIFVNPSNFETTKEAKVAFFKKKVLQLRNQLEDLNQEEKWEEIIELMEHVRERDTFISPSIYTLYMNAALKTKNVDLVLELLNESLEKEMNPYLGTLIKVLYFLSSKKAFKTKKEVDKLVSRVENAFLVNREKYNQIYEQKEIDGYGHSTLRFQEVTVPKEIYGCFSRLYLKIESFEESKAMYVKSLEGGLPPEDFISIPYEIQYHSTLNVKQVMEQFYKEHKDSEADTVESILKAIILIANNLKLFSHIRFILEFLGSKNFKVPTEIFLRSLQDLSEFKLKEHIFPVFSVILKQCPDELCSLVGREIDLQAHNVKLQSTIFLYKSAFDFCSVNCPELLKDPHLFNRMLKCAASWKDFSLVETVVSDMRKADTQLNSASYKILLFVHGILNMNECEFKRLISEMKEKNIPQDQEIATILSKSFDTTSTHLEEEWSLNLECISIVRLAGEGDLENAVKKFKEIYKRHLIPTAPVFTALVENICKSGRFKEAFMYFRMMRIEHPQQQRIFLNNLLIDGCPPEKIDFFYDQIVTSTQAKPNISTLNIFLKKYGDAGDIQKALYVYEIICKTFGPDLKTFSHLFSRAIKCRKLSEVLSKYSDFVQAFKPEGPEYKECVWIDYLFNNTERIKMIDINYKGSVRNVVQRSLSGLAGLFASGGDLESASMVIDNMIKRRIKINHGSHIFLVRCLGLARDEHLLRKVIPLKHDEISESQVWNSKLTEAEAFAQCGNVNESLKIFRELELVKDKRVEKHIKQYFSVLLSHFSSNGDELALQEYLQKCISHGFLSTPSINSVLSFYHSQSDKSKLFDTFSLFEKHSLIPDDTSFSLIFSSIDPSDTSTLLQCTRTLALSGTLLLDPEDRLNSALAKSLEPHVQGNFSEMMKQVASVSKNEPIFASDVKNLLNAINGAISQN